MSRVLKTTKKTLIWVVNSRSYVCEVLPEPCPACGKFSLTGLPDPIRRAQPDNTNVVCNPALKGCNQGYELDVTPMSGLTRLVI